MSSLLELREKLNWTQEDLAEKSNISVRTIQRIEAGTKPKGFTLESLSKALGVRTEVLLEEKSEVENNNKRLIKYINLSSIILLAIPFGSIIMPLVIIHWKKELNDLTKQIVSIQILWTILFPIVVLITMFLFKWLSFSKEIVPLTMLALLIINLGIILRNTVELENKNKLYIHLNFSFL